ncbi:SpoIID/LytB domain-containing protein [Cohnella algarum]|uniref:SpoIID/LytB domain-containing protein n=1 Tax=Cohnella algarum TaxID=2044859 RepID=UPI00196811D0|nr:SpoIID/LytB domain-containing protein [Cohnella algarum]MBN2984824.1 SpoIID/LytB domain-containing protein [Cohnella algarum]
MTFRLWSPLKRTAALGALLASLSLAPAAIAYGAADVPDTIRVAIFADIGSKYKSLISVASLSSADGMALVFASGQGNAPISAVSPGQTVKVAPDGYRAIVLETADSTAAISVLKKMQASTAGAYVTKLSKQGKTVYQVAEGGFSTAAQAASALSKWTGAGVAGGVESLTTAAVGGPLALEAGPYASEFEAQNAAVQFGNANVEAFVARKLSGGKPVYVVRAGQAADQSQLTKLQQTVAAAGLAARAPDASEPYVVLRQDLTDAAGATAPTYALSAEAMLRADPSGENGIQLAERNKRTYRGSMEVRILNGSLAVVNEVDLDQYLYSVVASEIYAGWPAEAQKAQAVAARSYALSLGMNFQIAHVVDTTVSQAYNGISAETEEAIAAVEATSGEVIVSGGKIVNAVFSSNAGGITADNKTEIWRGDNSFLSTAVQSPDSGPQEGKLDWYKAALSTGEVGYIRSDLLADSGQKNAAELPLLKVTGSDVAFRPGPAETNEPIKRLSAGMLVVPLDKVPEYTNYSWIEGPFTAEELKTSINKRATEATRIQGTLQTLEITGKGPSGRVTEIKANGKTVDVGAPDNWRGALGTKSTLIDIEETGRFAIAGADGEVRQYPEVSGSLQVLGADGAAATIGGGSKDNLFVLSGSGELRAATADPQFVIAGKGFGHGLGMSQWGAKGLADQGYDYQAILKYYYNNATIEKDGGE